MKYTAQEIVDLQEKENYIFLIKSEGYRVTQNKRGQITDSEELFTIVENINEIF